MLVVVTAFFIVVTNREVQKKLKDSLKCTVTATNEYNNCLDGYTGLLTG